MWSINVKHVFWKYEIFLLLFLYLTFKLFDINVQTNSEIVVNLDVG